VSSARKQRRVWYVVGTVCVVGFLAYGATAFKSNLTPYVGFDEAQRSGAKVQVAGGLVADSSQYLEQTQELVFAIHDDKGRVMPVHYKGTKPANFEEATQIVAVGSWEGDAFHAEQLLVKCPSKYQGIDSDPAKHGVEA
jgi:cytochrome c-type biogenesis protein CcmE